MDSLGPPNLIESEEQLEMDARGQDPGFTPETDEEQPSSHRYSITSYGTDLEVELLVKRLQSSVYTIPEYQRGYVWSQARASQFIESLIIGLPVPGIFLYRNPDRTFLVIDGHQRLKTLSAFYEKQFPGTNTLFTLKSVEERLQNLTIDSLAPDDRRALDSSVIHATIIEQEEPDEPDKTSVYQIFRRINSGAVPLTPHEIRYCVNYGTLARAIKEWNQTPAWRSLIGPVSLRMKDQELILRIIALWKSETHYTTPMQGYLDKFLENNCNMASPELEEVAWSFKFAVEDIYETLGPSAFRLSEATPVNAALADALTVAFLRRDRTRPRQSADRYASSLAELKAEVSFLDAITRATARVDAVKLRLRMAYEKFSTEF